MNPQDRAGAVIYAKDVARVSTFYVQTLGLNVVHTETDHVVLESAALQLVVLEIPAHIAGQIVITVPPERRTDTAVKLSFAVPSMAAVRDTAARWGGALNPAEREWVYRGFRHCDGHDPEGNVVQFREPDRQERLP
jgi:catechol 2,3-dioxygenase-like lactoylglutathione lyase family enzyme